MSILTSLRRLKVDRLRDRLGGVRLKEFLSDARHHIDALSVLFAAGATKVRTLPAPPRRSRPGPPSSPATPARHHDTAGAGLALIVPPSKR